MVGSRREVLSERYKYRLEKKKGKYKFQEKKTVLKKLRSKYKAN